MRKRATTAIVVRALMLHSGWASPTMAQRSKSGQGETGAVRRETSTPGAASGRAARVYVPT